MANSMTLHSSPFSPRAQMIAQVLTCHFFWLLTIASFDSGIPVALRAVTMLGVEQGRSWNTASLNEFRHFFGLVDHKSFKDVNSNPEMQKRLSQLYEHPDNIEIYPGILIENTKQRMTPGSGLCPNQTIGKAILSDAVALVRGDRFCTVVCMLLPRF